MNCDYVLNDYENFDDLTTPTKVKPPIKIPF